jgi:hypothetical protein
LIPELSRDLYQGTALAVPFRVKDAIGFSPAAGIKLKFWRAEHKAFLQAKTARF